MQIDFIASGLKMLGVLVLMIGVMAALNLYAKRMMNRRAGGRKGQRIRVLESALLGMKKSVALVQVPGSVLVLGVTGDRITLLDKIPEDRLPEAPPTGDIPHQATFKDQLGQVIRRMTGGDSADIESPRFYGEPFK